MDGIVLSDFDMFSYTLLALSGPLQLSPGVRYAAIFPAAAGFFTSITLIITWTLNNQASEEGKGTGVAMLNIIGQLGPLLGTRLYPEEDKPFYARGMSICAAFMALVAVLAWVLRRILKRANLMSGGGCRGGEYISVEAESITGAGEGREHDYDDQGGSKADAFVYIL